MLLCRDVFAHAGLTDCFVTRKPPGVAQAAFLLDLRR